MGILAELLWDTVLLVMFIWTGTVIGEHRGVTEGPDWGT